MAEGLSRAQLRQIESVLDRVEDRLVAAAGGLHVLGEPADARTPQASGLGGEHGQLWLRWNGLELFGGEIRIHDALAVQPATAQAGELGFLREGDLVIGERGRELYVLPSDPWAEGADVILVEEDGERSPFASTIPHLVLGLLGEATVLYDEEGEYQDELFGDDGELLPQVERRLLRRRLDFDEDAPLARFRLGQLLRRDGELRAAASELRAVVKRAPTFSWAQLELGRVCHELGQDDYAVRAFIAGAQAATDPGLEALCLAWAVRCGAADSDRLTKRALESYPELAGAHEAGAREAMEAEELDRARELIELGLAVAPKHLGLLDLRERLGA
jgi:hypothetical protein